jgi:hypothetical protein
MILNKEFDSDANITIASSVQRIDSEAGAYVLKSVVSYLKQGRRVVAAKRGLQPPPLFDRNSMTINS